MNIEDHIEMVEQQQVAPALLEKVADEEDTDALAEVCAEVESTLRAECKSHGLSKHAGQAACYMVVNRLADPERAGVADD